MTILAVFLGVALATSVDLQDQVDKLERRLHDSIEDAQKQAKKEAEMETALKEMEERLGRLGATMEKARQLSRQGGSGPLFIQTNSQCAAVSVRPGLLLGQYVEPVQHGVDRRDAAHDGLGHRVLHGVGVVRRRPHRGQI